MVAEVYRLTRARFNSVQTAVTDPVSTDVRRKREIIAPVLRKTFLLPWKWSTKTVAMPKSHIHVCR
jgi:hypothetical protein